MVVRVVLVGAGGIARRHAEILSRRRDCRIAAVVDPVQDAAEHLARRHDARAHTELRPALDGIDAAYVLTPPRRRRDTIALLTERGIPVLCEKPLAATAEEARELAALAAGSDAPFMMGFMRRWHPPYRDLAERIHSGSLGRLTQLCRTRVGRLALADDNWRVQQGQQVGVTIESLSHDLDLLSWLGGGIDSVDGAALASDAARPGFDDSVVATLRFASGAIGSLHVSWASDVPLNDLIVAGTAGAVAIRGDGMWDSREVRTSSEAGAGWMPVEPDRAVDDGYEGENDAFLRIVAGEPLEHPTVGDGVRTVELSEQLLARAGGIRVPG